MAKDSSKSESKSSKQDATESVKVTVRVRPFNSREKKLDANAESIITIDSLNSCTLKEPGTDRITQFAFDYCFGEDSTQEEVYEKVGKSIVDEALQGYNVCLFAYGQTGSGKSFTMIGGKDENLGIIPRISKDLFTRMEEIQSSDPTVSFELNTSMIEIYNEQIRDLRVINKQKKEYQPLQLRQHPVMGVYIQDVKWVLVQNYEELNAEFEMANKSKTVHNTMMNSKSSRAHTVFELRLTQQKTYNVKGKDFTEKRISKINLVDLAGSERSKKTEVETGGQRFKEGVNINLSLTTLGRVIKSLSEGENPPYRESVLTLLLKSSLGGNSKTYMISALSPHPNNYSETKSTLEYSKRAKKIQNKAKVNEDASILKELKVEIDTLKQQLLREKQNNEKASQLEAQLEESKKIIEELQKSIIETREEKLKATQHIQEVRATALKETGLNVSTLTNMLGVDIQNLPSLINLDEDSIQSGCLFYYLREGTTSIGKGESSNIRLVGVGMYDNHCEIQFNNQTHSVYINIIDNAKVLVNGNPIEGNEKVELHTSDRIIIGDQWYFRFQNPHESSKKSKELIDWEFAQRERFKQDEIRFLKQQEEKFKELELQRLQLEKEMKQMDQDKAKVNEDKAKIEEVKTKQIELEESVKKYEQLLEEEKNRTEQIQDQLLQASKERQEVERKIREEHEKFLAEEQTRTESEKKALLELKNQMELQLTEKLNSEKELSEKLMHISSHAEKVKREIESQRQEKQQLEDQLSEQLRLVQLLQETQNSKEIELKLAQEKLEKEKNETEKRLEENEIKSKKLQDKITEMKKKALDSEIQIHDVKIERDKIQILFEEKLKEQERMRLQYEKMLEEKDNRMKDIHESLNREKKLLEESNIEMKKQIEIGVKEISQLKEKHFSLMSELERTQNLIAQENSEKERLIEEKERIIQMQKQASDIEKEGLSKRQIELQNQLELTILEEKKLREKFSKIEQESKDSKALILEKDLISNQMIEKFEKASKEREEQLKKSHEEMILNENIRYAKAQEELNNQREQLDKVQKEAEQFQEEIRIRKEKEEELEKEYSNLLQKSNQTTLQLENEISQRENLQKELKIQKDKFKELIEKKQAEHLEQLQEIESEKSRIEEQLFNKQNTVDNLQKMLENALNDAQAAQSLLEYQNKEKNDLKQKLEDNEVKQLSLNEKLEEMEIFLQEQIEKEQFLKEEHEKRLQEEIEKTKEVQNRLLESKRIEEDRLNAILLSTQEQLRITEEENENYKMLVRKMKENNKALESEKADYMVKHYRMQKERDKIRNRLSSNLESVQHELVRHLEELNQTQEENNQLRQRLRELERELEYEKQMPLQIRKCLKKEIYIQNGFKNVYFTVDFGLRNSNFLLLQSGRFFGSSAQMMVISPEGYIHPSSNPNFVLTAVDFEDNAPIQLLPVIHNPNGSHITRNHQRWFFFEISPGSRNSMLLIANMERLDYVISFIGNGKPAILEKFSKSKLQQRWILKGKGRN